MFFSISFYGQVLHHQMLSSQGQSIELSNGLMVNQTIGQQSVTGNSSGDFVVMQGFQQSVWAKHIASNETAEMDDIKTTTYPNPFTETVNFEFSKPITDVVTVYVYDLVGRLVYEQQKQSNDTVLTINLSSLASSEYLVRLKTPKYIYYTKIIKK
jgi:hypothetical protein